MFTKGQTLTTNNAVEHPRGRLGGFKPSLEIKYYFFKYQINMFFKKLGIMMLNSKLISSLIKFTW